MTKQDIIKEVKKCVHSELNYSEYHSTNVRSQTNCYAYAIGSTFPYSEIYRIGAFSGLKPIEEKYLSVEEVKSLLEEDLKILELKFNEIDVDCNSKDFLEKIQKMELKQNQYVVLLFIKWYATGQIWDFHFWRFDKKQFSDKRWCTLPNKVDIDHWWESWNEKLISAYLITK